MFEQFPLEALKEIYGNALFHCPEQKSQGWPEYNFSQVLGNASFILPGHLALFIFTAIIERYQLD